MGMLIALAGKPDVLTLDHLENPELRDTVSMLRDQAAPLLSNLYALIVVQQDARQIAEAASATQEMVTDLLKEGVEMTRDNVA